ncbi:signal recognition particle-docking protein FtsY [Lapidilactobacillus achengensis]|uniref:Signal recognition particle receptor FtsY n=1 Tax=Lapidilactobacillus achengensis TaxID=2486000 RepID=A0ABW1URZ4_9LACO|nr:signal recognition particle-docking protein FtsY [Lapidilactobacillus achengensis]
MGFFDRVKKAFGGGKKEENTTPKQATETAANQASDQTSAPAAPAADQAAANTGAATPLTTKPAADQSSAATSADATAASDHLAAQPAATAEPTLSEPTAPELSSPEPTASKPVQMEPASTEPTSTESTSTESASTESASTEPTADEAKPDTQATTPSPAAVTPVPAPSDTPAESPATATTDADTNIADTDTAETNTADAATSETGSVAAYDQGLSKSRHGFAARLNQFLAGFRTVDEDFFEDLEEMLIEADVGFETAMTISDQLRDEVKLQNAKSKKQVGLTIVEKMVDLYGAEGAAEDNHLHFAASDQGPTVFLFVGVNGAGKTTTVGKLAARLKGEGQKVLLAAADTFRAGAIEQLATWARRVGVDCVTSDPGADPASVVFEAVQKAKAEHYDILLVDTAGRLQNKVNLMNELAKIKRVIVRELPQAPQEVLLVLDASTGQNALSQAKQFKETTNVTGIVLTKLDGSSKGGIVIAIRNELHLPVKLVGLGEKMTDLADFDAEKFVYGLFKGLIDDA